MKLIGKGAFTKCYLQDCGKKVLLISSDPIKECMGWGWFPESTHFPKVTVVNNGAYEMDYYGPTVGLKAHLDADNWQLYQVLRDVMSRINHQGRAADMYSQLYGLFEAARERSENRVVINGLSDCIEALDACANYGSDIGFEISPRNVRAKNGMLVLMDCFFMIGKLREVRK